MAQENIDVTVDLHDALSRPAGRAEEALEDLGNEVTELQARLAAMDAQAKRNEKSLAALRAASGKATDQTKQQSKATKALEVNAKAAAAGTKLLGMTMKAIMFSAFALAATLAASALSALGAAAFAAVAGLAPLVNTLGAIPALLAAIIGGVVAVKLGFSGVGEALKVVTDSEKGASETAAAMAKLSPPAREFVTLLASMKKETAGWKDEIQAVMLPKFGLGLEAVSGVFPVIERGLVRTGSAVGDLVVLIGDELSMRGRDLGRIFKQSTSILRTGFNPALAGTLAILLDLAVAGGPLAQRFARWLGDSAQAMSLMTAEGRRSGGLQAGLKRAGDLAADLGAFIGDVSIALFNTGKQADAMTGLMGHGITDLASRWRAWTETVEGQNAIAQWFADARPLMVALADTFGILARGFGNLATSGDLAALIDQINRQLLPALVQLAEGAVGDLGPALVTLATAFVQFQSVLAMSPIAESLLGLATAASAVLSVINDLPGPVKFLIASFLALKLMTFGLTKAMPLLQGALGAGLVGTFSNVRKGAVEGSRGVGFFNRALGAGMGAIGGFKGAGAGLVAAMGGPWSIAIMAGVTALGMWAANNAKAKARAQAFRATLDEQTGAVTANTEAWAANELITSEGGGILGIGKSGIMDKAGQLGLDLQKLTDAAAGNSEAYQDILDDLTAIDKEAGAINNPFGADAQDKRNVDAVRGSVQDLYEAAQKGTRANEQYARATDDVAGATGAAATAVDYANPAIRRHQDALNGAEDSLRGTADQTYRVITATTALDDMFVKRQRTLIGFRQTMADAAKVLAENKRTLDLHTQAGRDNRSALLDVAEAAAGVENKAKRVQAIKEARTRIREWAQAAGWGEERARKYANELFGLTRQAEKVPEKVRTDVEVKGVDKAKTDLEDLIAQFDYLSGFVDMVIPGVPGATYVPRNPEVPPTGGRRRRPRRDGGPVWAGGDFTVGEVGPELLVGAGGSVSVIGAAGPENRRFHEDGFVLPNDYYEAARTAALPEAPAPAPTSSGESSFGGELPDVHNHFHGDTNGLTEADIEAATKRAWERFERERRERR